MEYTMAAVQICNRVWENNVSIDIHYSILNAFVCLNLNSSFLVKQDGLTKYNIHVYLL